MSPYISQKTPAHVWFILPDSLLKNSGIVILTYITLATHVMYITLVAHVTFITLVTHVTYI